MVLPPDLTGDERRFLELRETLRLYASVAHERSEATPDETGDASDLKAKELAKVAQAILGMDPEDSPVRGH